MEKFKQIKDYENYLISNEGRVFSYYTKKFLKPGKGSHGYLTVNLYKNDGGKSHSIHRLVANAFIPNVLGKRTINHMDGIKTNNFSTNLEWNTQKENNHHAYDTGLKDNKGIKNGRAKLSENQVLEIRKLYKAGEYTKTALGKMFGVSDVHIGSIIRRELWNHI